MIRNNPLKLERAFILTKGAKNEANFLEYRRAKGEVRE